MQFSSIWAHVTLDNERSVGEVVISDCVADDTFQTKIACDEQRRRSPAVDPATSELVELRHVAVDPLGALQTQVFVLQLLQLSLTHICAILCNVFEQYFLTNTVCSRDIIDRLTYAGMYVGYMR